MDRIEKIRNSFRLDKWWGNVVFVSLHYLLFWWLFYGIWFLLPYKSFVYLVTNFTKIAPYYIFGLAPIISFILPYNIKKFVKINSVLLYLLHLLLIAGAVFLFFLFAVLIIYKNYIPGLY